MPDYRAGSRAASPACGSRGRRARSAWDVDPEMAASPTRRSAPSAAWGALVEDLGGAELRAAERAAPHADAVGGGGDPPRAHARPRGRLRAADHGADGAGLRPPGDRLRPGPDGARAAARAVLRHRVRPGRHPGHADEPGADPTIADTDTGGDARFVTLANAIGALVGPFNYLGLPAVSLPVGFDRNGMPVGLQLVGKPFAEGLLLRAAHAFERATGVANRRPPA